MNWRSEDLIPVRSEGELRAGMTVVLKGCVSCKATADHVVVVVGRSEAKCMACLEFSCWSTIDHCPVLPGRPMCFRSSIHEGRLFRLDTGIDEEADARQARSDAIRAAVHSFNNWIPAR